jgi:hypothetical protein
MVKSKRVRWDGYVARMWVRRNAYKILVGKSQGKEYLGDLSIDGRIMMNMIQQQN